AELLRRRMEAHGARCWLINTGWSGGPYGVGRRIPIGYTRAMVQAALSGALDGAGFEKEPYFGLLVPRTCPGVPPEVLSPQATWQDKEAYRRQAEHLKGLFKKNFSDYAGQVDPAVRSVMA
ncbi:phosphoenolpyruvate carboxykinase (ATP), partial [Thermogutta sp.]|uniref:phosphoenolpyruvate carboxykinase (ATP) n=1 Tax=Thermogutta sp. TaxID=1962930 RepID=UPI003220758A